MIEYYKYDLAKYDFVSFFENLFEIKNLQKIHEGYENLYREIKPAGKDSDTHFHRKFYDYIKGDYKYFEDIYKSFIKENIVPTLNTKDIIYQKFPSFRVHLSDNLAVGGWHRDIDYNHPEGEINFIVALTPMFESNTTITETEQGKMDFQQIILNVGQFAKFDGNKCLHGNLPNKTGVSRLSFDFRILPMDKYKHNDKTSISNKNKFIIGDYYQMLEL